MGSHSRTTDVWVALRQRRTGGEGEEMPKVVRMEFWSAEKDFWAAASEARLRATVISTILPEEIEGGRRMDGNSIWMEQSQFKGLGFKGRNGCSPGVYLRSEARLRRHRLCQQSMKSASHHRIVEYKG